MEDRLSIPVQAGVAVSALRTLPREGTGDIVVAYAPGAGSDLRDPFGAFLAAFLAGRGIESWRFQFPYSEQGKRAPDRPPLLMATWRAVIAASAASSTEGARIVIGGRSMGGRIASLVAAEGAPVAALALFAYPLQPPGRESAGRAAHFAKINVPALFVSGTRDAFGTPEQLRQAAALVPDATVHLIEGADHGFATLKSSGRSREDVWQEACDALLTFLRGPASRQGPA